MSITPTKSHNQCGVCGDIDETNDLSQVKYVSTDEFLTRLIMRHSENRKCISTNEFLTLDHPPEPKGGAS